MRTTPTAAELTAAVKKTMTSAAFTKFMEQAVHTAVANLQDETSNVVLRAEPTSLVRFGHSSGFTYYECQSADGTCETHLQTNRFDENPKRRNYWYGSESRTDEQGRTWTRQLGYMVQDDFGFLVEVAA